MDERQTQASPSMPSLIEEGAAFHTLLRKERFDVIVIGGGQAGLSVGYHLRRRGLKFVILDANPRIGDSWRQRWDSLRLFTPARFNDLDGMRFPGPGRLFPTKDQMGDYLEAYAARFELPVRSGVRVERLYRRDGVFVAKTGDRELEAEQVVVAMASYQKGRTPEYAKEIAGDIVQLHGSEYRNPGQLRPGPVLIVGAGNSGAEIALETARAGHPTSMAGRNVGHLPFRIHRWFARVVLCRLILRVLFHRLLTIRTPMGRKLRPQALAHGGPLIRVKPQDLAAAGVACLPRVQGVQDGRPILEDGRALDVANVIWCTGYHPGHAWIDLPIFDQEGHARHEGGIVPEQPGLYFVGLHFLYSVSSTMIHGVGRDARRIVRAVMAQKRAPAPGSTERPVFQAAIE